MPEQDLPDAADCGDTTREDAVDRPGSRAETAPLPVPSSQGAMAMAQAEVPAPPSEAASFDVVPPPVAPVAPAMPPTAAPEPAVVADGPVLADRVDRPRRIFQWRSFSGWFCLLWLVALGWLVSVALHGPGTVTELPRALLAKTAVAAALAVILAFLVPISLVDDSSHHRRAWWVAWLWPPVMVLMLVADVAVLGGVAVKLMPLVQLLKKH